MKDEKEFIKLRCTNIHREVYHHKDYLCCFGGSDLNIYSDCNLNYKSYSRFRSDYECPPDNDYFALAGSLRFRVIEIEVYELI